MSSVLVSRRRNPWFFISHEFVSASDKVVMEDLESKLSPESYFPGAASLLDQLDKKILIVLVDGRHLVGILRSFDHFSVSNVFA